nr:MAG TPA: hypothetical protein [Caudoviricetes sp.]
MSDDSNTYYCKLLLSTICPQQAILYHNSSRFCNGCYFCTQN